MNNPNPFVPKGSILEAQSQRRSRLKLAVFCVIAVGVAGLSAMLIQGCKREQPVEPVDATSMLDTNPPVMNDTNPPISNTNPISYTPPPTNPAPFTPPVPPATTEYTVVKGDTFATIAKKHSVTVNALKAANPTVVPTKLQINHKLQIPTPTASVPTPAAMIPGADAGAQTYTVKSGDTLSKIAKAHGTTVKLIQAENNLATTAIKVGQKLKMPVKAEAAAPAPAMPEPAAMPAPTAPVTPSADIMPGH